MNSLAQLDEDKGGFTLIELLIVIAIILILGTMASPFISRFMVQTYYETTVDKVVGTIRKAQMYSMNGKNGVVWGFCLTSNKIRVYQGTCASPTTKEDFDIPSTISVSGLSDTTFSLRRGEPNQSLTITIQAFVGTTTITLNRAGGMTVQ
jgi:prepilin-type N-terminal cleavage/methylation domain-containing protein